MSLRRRETPQRKAAPPPRRPPPSAALRPFWPEQPLALGAGETTVAPRRPRRGLRGIRRTPEWPHRPCPPPPPSRRRQEDTSLEASRGRWSTGALAAPLGRHLRSRTTHKRRKSPPSVCPAAARRWPPRALRRSTQGRGT
eukprot:scaffold4500_cov352-Pinguiococcus_pyrenoidosus.AAC.2